MREKNTATEFVIKYEERSALSSYENLGGADVPADIMAFAHKLTSHNSVRALRLLSRALQNNSEGYIGRKKAGYPKTWGGVDRERR